jgi:hypothetical protein
MTACLGGGRVGASSTLGVEVPGADGRGDQARAPAVGGSDRNQGPGHLALQ